MSDSEERKSSSVIPQLHLDSKHEPPEKLQDELTHEDRQSSLSFRSLIMDSRQGTSATHTIGSENHFKKKPFYWKLEDQLGTWTAFPLSIVSSNLSFIFRKGSSCRTFGTFCFSLKSLVLPKGKES